MKRLFPSLLLIAAIISALVGHAQTKDFITAVVSKTETVQVKSQTRVVRIEIFAENPKDVRMVSHHLSERLIAGETIPSGAWVTAQRTLAEAGAATATIDGITLTREQLIAFAVAFAEADRATDLAALANVK